MSRQILKLREGAAATLVRGAVVLSAGKENRDQAVLWERGKIRAVGKSAIREARKRRAVTIDAGGAYLAPGFLDLHTHGAKGVDFVEASETEFARALGHYARHGVTGILVSLYPSSWKKSLTVTRRVAGYIQRRVGNGIAIGIHLEGPFLSPRRPGALPARQFRDYDRADVDALLGAGDSCVRVMTIAPERSANGRLTRHLLRSGVVPAFGHSDSAYEETRQSIQGGIRFATHLFNAMRGIHHREPGAVGALLEDDRVVVELIADGHHVDVPVLRMTHGIKPPHGIVLVSDSASVCGHRPGKYEFVGATVTLKAGKVTLDDGTLAGSALTLDEAMRLFVSRVGVTPAEAVQLVSENPARVIGEEDKRGSIRPGMRADVVLLDKSLRVLATWVEGRQVWRSGRKARRGTKATPTRGR